MFTEKQLLFLWFLSTGMPRWNAFQVVLSRRDYRALRAQMEQLRLEVQETRQFFYKEEKGGKAT